MKSDIEIARETELKDIRDIAQSAGVPDGDIECYGKYMAKLPLSLISADKAKVNKLILVTAITPTKAGIGKTTVSVGLGMGLAKIGKNAACALREPSLGPVFGMKGGAAGGGYAQVLPMENINLHFTGDFHAITSAHNTISALLDNYIYRHRGTEGELREVLWKRVLDVNDRSLRSIVTGLGGSANGIPQESGFDITAASELMAILCLANDEADLRRRVENILLGYTVGGSMFTVKDLGAAGAVVVLLREAVKPNLVQTNEHTPAFVHGGPFANIAHGCNSVLATRMSMSFAEYTVTEAGFGADLGAEKFFNIKCRKSGLCPSATIIVATSQGLKMHGGTPEADIRKPDMAGLTEGFKNMQRHIDNMRSFGQSVIIAFNRYGFDVDEEIEAVRAYCEAQGVPFAVCNAFVEGGEGAVELAKVVVDTIENKPSSPIRFTYPDDATIEEKIEAVARNLYGAGEVIFDAKARKMLKAVAGTEIERFPVCIAKTQYSFSAEPHRYGVVEGFTFKISDIVINRGSEFVVAIAGQMMRMPGLPAVPAANHIDLVDGEIVGLS